MISDQFSPRETYFWKVPLAVYSPGLHAAATMPVAMRPSLPMGYNPVPTFHPPPPFPRTVVAVRLRSPPPPVHVLHNTDMLLKNAVWGNGIKVGTPNVEQDTNSDANAVNFEELAKQNGIKIGKSEVKDNQNLDIFDNDDDDHANDDDDTMVMNFEELAKQNGIKIGKSEVKDNQNLDVLDDDNDGDGDDKDAMVMNFEELAKQNGIKIGKSEVKDDQILDVLDDDNDGDGDDNDAMVMNFEELAKQNGIKIGKSEVKDDQNLDVLDDDNDGNYGDDNNDENDDAMVMNFEELARRSGIRVGEQTEASSSPTEILCVNETAIMSPTYLAENLELRNVCVTKLREVSATELFEIQAKKCGIRLGNESEALLSCGDTLTACDEDEVFYVEDVEESPFEYLTGHHEIEINQSSPEFIPGSTHRSASCLDLFEERASKHGIQINRPIIAHVHTQTVLEPVVNAVQSTQTSQKDLGIESVNSAVQVDVVPEAFKEEFINWTLDESRNDCVEEISYKTLYLAEHTGKNELEKKLESEMDLGVRMQRSHKQAMEQMKKELNNKEENIEKLKKEVKTIKKHKETEIKRLNKEKKQHEEAVESMTKKLSLKDVALETMREILENQTTQIKQLEAKVKQLGESSPEQHCEKCLHQQSAVKRNSSPSSAGSDEWSVYTSAWRRQQSSSADPLQHSWTNNIKMDELSEIKLSKSTAGLVKDLSNAADNDCGLSGSRNLLKERSSKSPSSSPPVQHPPIWPKDTERMPGKVDELSDVSISKLEQIKSVVGNDDGSASGVDDRQSQEHLYQVDSKTKRKTSGDRGNCGAALPPGLGGQIKNPKQSCLRSQSQSNDYQFGADVSCIPAEDSGTGACEKSNFTAADTNLESGLPSSTASGPSHNLPYLAGVNSQNLYRYLSTLISDPANQNGDKGGFLNVPPPPPGLNTIPVPTEMPVSSAQGGACKFGTFDKLMSALRKRFPEHSRSDLITYLKKAKADCGPVGFRGKQISEVVEHVAKVMRVGL